MYVYQRELVCQRMAQTLTPKSYIQYVRSETVQSYVTSSCSIGQYDFFFQEVLANLSQKIHPTDFAVADPGGMGPWVGTPPFLRPLIAFEWGHIVGTHLLKMAGSTPVLTNVLLSDFFE